MADVMDEPLAPEAARRLIYGILKDGRFTYSRHAKEEMLDDDLTTVDSRTCFAAVPYALVSTSTERGDTGWKPARSPSSSPSARSESSWS
jgi:hypothetical protein